MLRTSMLLSSVLVNSESWYNLSSTDIQELESVDNMLHRRILETAKSTPISIMHLELGTIPIRYVIKSRRLHFLQYILKQDKDSLLYKIFQVQSRYPQKGDWILQIRQDLEDVKLTLSFDEISILSDDAYHTKVKKAIKQSAFNWLINEKNKPWSSTPSKGSNLKYSELKLQDYFFPCSMTNKQCNILFSNCARMLPMKCNCKHSYSDLRCPVCMDTNHPDTQMHITQCDKLLESENMLVSDKVDYEDIYSTDIA